MMAAIFFVKIATVVLRIRRTQVLPIRLDQVPPDVGVQRRLGVRIFLRYLEDVRRARSEQEVADQHAAFAVDEGLEQAAAPLAESGVRALAASACF